MRRGSTSASTFETPATRAPQDEGKGKRPHGEERREGAASRTMRPHISAARPEEGGQHSIYFPAFSTKALVKVFDRSMCAFFTAGDDWLNTASTAAAPFGSILPSSEYIGIVFLSAAI